MKSLEVREKHIVLVPATELVASLGYNAEAWTVEDVKYNATDGKLAVVVMERVFRSVPSAPAIQAAREAVGK